MHSNGHGEETPEPYRGAALPPQQQPPATYGESVQPAGGTPWGDPSTQGAGSGPVPPPLAPQQPAEAADATQMLPPFPAGGPASAPPPMPPGPPPGHVPFAAQAPQPGPVPYAEPAQQPQPQPGPVPYAEPAPQPQPGPVPFAEATQMLPPYPGGQPQPQPPQPEAAEATQAMPLYQEQPQGYDEYGRPFPPAQPQQYGGQQQFADPAGYDQPAPAAPDSDYDHLFRNDVPGPEPMRPRILQPHAPQEPQQPWQQQPGYGGGAYDGYERYDDEDGGRRRMSPKVLVGIVVAGCVVAGLVVGGLMNSGGKASADNAGGTSPSASASAPGTSPAAGGGKKDDGADAAEAQAKALDALLASSNASRSSVVSAVESIKGCKDLSKAAADLRAAASQRDGLVTKLGTLSVDKLPDHGRLTTALTKAWNASSAADGHYAKWADQAANNHGLCKGGHARTTAETQAGNRESGTATAQKKTAVKLWNSIAATYDLTKRKYSQL